MLIKSTLSGTNPNAIPRYDAILRSKTQQTAQSQQVSQKHHLQIPAERICKAIIPYPKHPAKIQP